MLLVLETLNQPDRDRADFQLITPVHALLGEKAYGVSAGHASLHLTLRAWTDEQMEVLVTAVKEQLAVICEGAGIGYAISWTNNFAANANEAGLTAALPDLLTQAGIPYKSLAHPFKWGEDFGYFTQRYRGLFLGLGAGETMPALHNPDYDFPDELLDKGVQLFRLMVDASGLG
jgi:metal-dependent amidase/aminoacylase/carboxypeptidase family protein